MHTQKVGVRPIPAGCSSLFRREVSRIADLLKLDLEQRKEFENLAQNLAWGFLSDLRAHQNSPTVSAVLKQLRSLKNAMANRGRLRGSGPLLTETISALMGEFPASSLELVDLHGKLPPVPAINDRAFLTLTTDYLGSIKLRQGERPVFEVYDTSPPDFEVMSALGLLKNSWRFPQLTFESLRHVLKGKLRSEFEVVAQLAIENVETTFGFEPEESPGSIKVIRGRFASPVWNLAWKACILLQQQEFDQKLNRKSFRVFHDFILLVIDFALGDKQDPENPADYKDLCSEVFTLNRQMTVLGIAIRFLQRRFANFSDVTRYQPWKEYPWSTQERLYCRGLYWMADWRRELYRRLYMGDYRPHQTNLRRASGGVLEVPSWPTLRNEWPKEKVSAELLTAALKFATVQQEKELKSRLITPVSPKEGIILSTVGQRYGLRYGHVAGKSIAI